MPLIRYLSELQADEGRSYIVLILLVILEQDTKKILY